MSQTTRRPPTILEQIGTLIFHFRERSRLALKCGIMLPAATVATARLGQISGLFLVQNKNDYIQRYQHAGEFFEASELELITQYFKGGVYVDVGANVGNHVVYFAQLKNCTKIIAFEPNPPALRILKINILLNNIGSLVELHDCALGPAESTQNITYSANNLGSASIQSSGLELSPRAAGSELIPIRVKVGDNVLSKTHVDFIKIDVEGFEMEVLKGLAQTIRRCLPTLFVEVWQENRAAFEAYLASLNYKIITALRNGGFDLILAQPAPASGEGRRGTRRVGLAKFNVEPLLSS